jgi:hypothetical protein
LFIIIIFNPSVPTKLTINPHKGGVNKETAYSVERIACRHIAERRARFGNRQLITRL